MYRVGWQTKTVIRPCEGKEKSVLCGDVVSPSVAKQFGLHESRYVRVYSPPQKDLPGKLVFHEMSSVTVALHSSLVKFSVDLRELLLSICEFRENRCIESHTLKTYLTFCTNFHPIWSEKKNWYMRCL